MACCRKSKNLESKNGMVPSVDRKCRDVLCCILFLIYWVGMILVAIVASKHGKPLSLVYAKDFSGNVCGDGKNLQNSKYIFYPRLNEDMLYAIKNNIALNKMQYFGICVPSCPTAGDTYCGYGNLPNTTCYTSTMITKNYFYRCLPVQNQNITTDLQRCIEPIGADYTCTVQKFANSECTEICKVTTQRIIEWQTKESSENPVLNQLQTTSQTFGRLFGDVKNSAIVIFIFGVGAAFILGILWLILLKYFATTMVWLTCLLVILSSALLSLYCSVKGELISISAFNFIGESNTNLISNQISGQVTANGVTINTSEFKVAAYITWVITAILVLLIVAMFSRIRIATAIIQEASKCIQRMPLLILWPVIPSISVLAIAIYWTIFASYILSSNSVTFKDLTKAIGSSSNISISISNTNVTGLGQVPDPTAQNVLFIYHLFGFLWTNQLIQAISICTIGGAVAEYYWTLPNQFGKRDLNRFPVASALKRTIRFSLGSLCFGSLIIAFVELIRVIMAYIDNQTKTLQKSNLVIKIVMKVVQCCLWCFEKCLKFLSKNAYIIIAMKGNSFCSSAIKAFHIILHNFARVSVVNTISFFLLLLAKITIVCLVGIATFTITSSPNYYAKLGGKGEISSPIAPVIVACLFAYFISSTFLNTYDMTIDTLLLCFCEDTKMNDGKGSGYMSPQLQRIMGYDNKNTAVEEGKPVQIQVSPRSIGAIEQKISKV